MKRRRYNVVMFEGITLTVAIVGAVTGILGSVVSLWTLHRQIDDDRVKLRVAASWAYLVGPGAASHRFSVAVTNLSKFPVTVDQVGVLLPENQVAIHPLARTADGRQLPIRMEPRTAFTLLFPADFVAREIADATAAFASTSCGERRLSKSGVVRRMMRNALG